MKLMMQTEVAEVSDNTAEKEPRFLCLYHKHGEAYEYSVVRHSGRGTPQIDAYYTPPYFFEV